MDKPGCEDEIIINTSDPRQGLGIVFDLLVKKIWPLAKTIRKKLQNYSKSDSLDHDFEKRLQDQLTICCSQLNKCVLNLFEIFKLECKQGVLLQESRNCTTQRLSWCIKKLKSLDVILASNLENGNLNIEDYDESFLATPMYFVNWIDSAFENLTKLSEIIYSCDHNNSGELYDLWQNEMVSCVSELHLCLDELLLSAMTLCRYCLPSDQHVVKARCQVVLRETKSLLAELITGDQNGTYIVTKDTLKLPIMPSNVNVLIDVLKDVLYALETNTNTALLGLLIDCFSNTRCPTERLTAHLMGVAKGVCACIKDGEDISESCEFVKEFDLHNERLMQIGMFAVSCSSDLNRISVLRSGLASLEALDPHLVPALIMSPDSAHSELLRSSWQREVKDIRDSVFLIVDPAAFADKCKQMMHQHLLNIVEQKCRDVSSICLVINIGSTVHEFFHVYNTQEPEALSYREELAPKLDDLNKVQMEVKVVANLVFSEEKLLYSVKMPKTKKEATMDQLIKRLKLLYTITSRINCVFHPKENEDQLFVNEICEEVEIKASNVTHTINPNFRTFVNSPRKTFNISRSAFARTVNRSPSNKFVLKKLAHHWKPTELSFSLKLDALFDLSINGNNESLSMALENKTLSKVRESSVLYKFSPKNCKSSLRKAVLKRNYEVKPIPIESFGYGDDDFIDGTTSLQITEILDQLNDMTNILNKSKQSHKIHPISLSVENNTSTEPQNVLTININKDVSHVSKQIWNIPVNMSTVEISLNDIAIKDVSNASSQRSNVTTLERLKDLDILENRLKGLKSMDHETAL